ncbi:MAG: prepilin-type N-terminal cleavage/methylation domain-containing protein [Desulfobacterales bacterium]|nr:prepilin-type N-terminal cleavage/methylation domain-containing protein [Desulfobacterales bacterium]
MLQKLRSGNEKGFTLIELMIVIAIIGILAAIAIPNFIAYRNKAYCSRAENDAQNILAGIACYFAEPDNFNVPTVGILQADGICQVELSNEEGASSVIYVWSGSSWTAATAQGFIADGIAMAAWVEDESELCPRGSNYTAYLGTEILGNWR